MMKQDGQTMQKEKYEPPKSEIVDLAAKAKEQGIDDLDAYKQSIVMMEEIW